MSANITDIITKLSQLAADLPQMAALATAAQSAIGDLQGQLDAANAHAADLQKQLDAALHPQTPPVVTPPAPPTVQGLIVTPYSDGTVRLNATQQTGVKYQLGTRDNATAPVLPLGTPVDFPVSVTPNKGIDYGLVVTPIRDGVIGTPIETRIQVKLSPPPPFKPPVVIPPVQPPTDVLFGVILGQAGTASFFDGSNVQTDNPAASSWIWTFGDNSPDRRGFNAGHIYAQPGKYTVTLSIRNAAGTIRAYKQTIEVQPSTRKIIAVPAGTDLAKYNGASNVELVLSKAAYSCSGAVIGGVIQGNDATINQTGALSLTSGSAIFNATLDYPRGALAADLTGYTRAMIDANTGMAIYPQGQAIAIVGCTFLNVAYAVNGNRCPTGVLIEGCSAPKDMRGYLGYVQGHQWVFYANTVINPIVEHVIRCEGINNKEPSTLLAVDGNTFSNLSGRWSGDDSKGCVAVHWLRWAYVSRNKIIGTGGDAGGVGFGPLMQSFIPGNPERSDLNVCEENENDNAPVRLDPGAVHTSIRGNTFVSKTPPEVPNIACIIIRATDTGRGRSVQDLTIASNNNQMGCPNLSITQGTVAGMESDWQ